MSQPDKTLLVSEIFPPRIGGSGSWLWEIYRRLPADNFTVLAGDHPDAVSFDEQGALDIRRSNLSSPSWSLFDSTGRSFYRRIYNAISQCAKERSITHVQCARVMPEGIAAYFCKRFMGIPYTCYIHGEDITLAVESRESRFLVGQVLKHASHLICNSENTKRILNADWTVEASKVVVMNPGVDTNRFKPVGNDSALREQFGWTGKKVILTVSRLEKRKGHDQMIKAMDIIRHKVPNAMYAIVGDGVEVEFLSSEVNRLELESWVRFYDPASDAELPTYYQACDLFILPNRTVGSSIEGFGIVLLEAQACGKPVIAGDSGGTAETLEDGVTGTIVDATNPETIASQVIAILNDDTQLLNMGKRARQRTLERFEWSKLADEAAQLFQTL